MIRKIERVHVFLLLSKQVLNVLCQTWNQLCSNIQPLTCCRGDEAVTKWCDVQSVIMDQASACWKSSLRKS